MMVVASATTSWGHYLTFTGFFFELHPTSNLLVALLLLL
jgi:hypothetical protein